MSEKVNQLLNQIDQNCSLDNESMQLLMLISDEFIENVVVSASNLSSHRRSDEILVKDIQLILEKKWDISVKGFGNLQEAEENQKVEKKTIYRRPSEIHKERLSLLKKQKRKG